MKKTTSEPIKHKTDIRKIKELLKSKPWSHALFTLGIGTNLELADLLSIRISQVENLPPGKSFDLVEKKSGKKRSINLNAECTEAIANFLKRSPSYNRADLLFTTDSGAPTPSSLVNDLVVSWCASINLTGHFTGETLRKTWAYIQKTTFGVDISTLKVCLDQPSEKATSEYLTLS